MADLAAKLHAGCEALGLNLDENQQRMLLAYLALLQKWNKVYNLTAVRDQDDMLSHHLLDSLAVVTPLRRMLVQQPALSPRVLDVGSGGGLPGVVLAIVCPELQVTCVDAVAKKAAFIQQAATHLGLPNLQGVHARVETLAGPFDVICSRAFATLADFTAWSQEALAPHGVWLAMKGKHPAQEIDALPAEVHVFHVEPLHVPGLNAERCIVWMRG